MKHFVWISLLYSSQVYCQQMQNWKDYDIHYSTFPSKLIPVDVATAHNIVRADNRIIINVSIRKKEVPIRAEIHGTVLNLLSQEIELTFTEVTEQQAIYYIASQIVNEKDTISLQIFIKPEPGKDTYKLEFTRKYY